MLGAGGTTATDPARSQGRGLLCGVWVWGGSAARDGLAAGLRAVPSPAVRPPQPRVPRSDCALLPGASRCSWCLPGAADEGTERPGPLRCRVRGSATAPGAPETARSCPGLLRCPRSGRAIRSLRSCPSRVGPARSSQFPLTPAPVPPVPPVLPKPPISLPRSSVSPVPAQAPVLPVRPGPPGAPTSSRCPRCPRRCSHPC